MFLSALDKTEAAVAELVRSFRDDSLPAIKVDHALTRVAALQHSLSALEADLALMGAEAGIWRRSGHASPGDWHAAKTGTSVGKAKAKTATAERLRQLPKTKDRYDKGLLSAEQADAVASAAVANPAAEDRLLESAMRDSLSELQDKAAAVRAAATDPEAQALKQKSLRRLRKGRDHEGMITTYGAHTPQDGALVWTAIDLRTEEIFTQARQDGVREPRDAYAADALVGICSDYLAQHNTAAPAAEDTNAVETAGDEINGKVKGRRKAKRKRLTLGAAAKVIVRVDHRVLSTGEVRDGDVCEIVGYGPVPVSLIKELMQDSFIAAVLTDGTQITKVVHLGRKPTAIQTTALQDLYSTCTIAGCGRSERLQTDHWKDWSETKHTTLGELERLCSYHHSLKTRGWTLHRNPDGTYRLERPADADADADADTDDTGAERQPRAG